MSLIESLLVVLVILLIYFILVLILHRKGILKKYNISFMGPSLMWRTKKGLHILKKIAKRKRFWKAFGSSGVVLCYIVMIIMTLLVIWQAWFIFELSPAEREELPLSPEFILAIPGINPLLPMEYFGYIILAFIIAIVVHEFSHGILTYMHNLKVKSLGILYFIVPIGAFCEPDEKQLSKAKPSSRLRIFAAGPTMNFLVVLISIFLFSGVFMSAVHPAADGIGIYSVDGDSPAGHSNLQPGMIITSINNTNVTSYSDYAAVILQTRANQTVTISYVQGHHHYTSQIQLTDMYEEYQKRQYIVNESVKDIGYLGVNPNPYIDFLPILQNPLSDFPQNFAFYWAIPFLGFAHGFNPLVSPINEYYIIEGPLGILPDGIFWVIINALYWIFWLNLVVALFNVLPMIPLDGGFLFNDAIGSFIKRLKKDISDEQREKAVKNVSVILSLLILFMVLFPFLIKYF